MPNKYLCPDAKWGWYLNSDQRWPEGICVYGAVGNLGLCLHPRPPEVTVCLLEPSIFPMATQPINIVGKPARRCAAALRGRAGTAPKTPCDSFPRLSPANISAAFPAERRAWGTASLTFLGLRQEWECCHGVYWINMCYCCSHLSVQFWRSCRWPFKYLQGLQLFQSGFFSPPFSKLLGCLQ